MAQGEALEARVRAAPRGWVTRFTSKALAPLDSSVNAGGFTADRKGNKLGGKGK